MIFDYVKALFSYFGGLLFFNMSNTILIDKNAQVGLYYKSIIRKTNEENFNVPFDGIMNLKPFIESIMVIIRSYPQNYIDDGLEVGYANKLETIGKRVVDLISKHGKESNKTLSKSDAETMQELYDWFCKFLYERITRLENCARYKRSEWGDVIFVLLFELKKYESR